MRKAARFATIAGAVGSQLFFWEASATTPILLRMVLAGWVFFPFLMAFFIDLRSKRWVPWVRTTLYGVKLAVGVGALTLYGFDLRPASASAGFLFVAVPAASLALLAIVLCVAALVSKQQSE